MPTTWIDVARDAVQIGLGAFIGGAFAWLLAIYNSKRESAKMRFERRDRILSECASRLDEIFSAWSKFSSLLLGLANVAQSPPLDEEEALHSAHFLANEARTATELQAAALDKAQDGLLVQSQLMLLGEKKCRQAVEELILAILRADKAYKFDGERVDLTEYVPRQLEIRAARERLFNLLNQAIERD